MSTFNTTDIESTSGGNPNFSQGLNVGGSAIGTLITITEYYSQANAPSSPANGAFWWSGSVAYQYVGGTWLTLTVALPPSVFGGRGVFGGGTDSGYSNVIDYITIATPGNATDFGDLTTARKGLAACSNGTRGIFGGGEPGVFQNGTNVIDYVTITVPSNATDFGDLTVGRKFLAACSNGSRGVFGGGQQASGNNNTLDYVTISTTGNATDFGDFSILDMTRLAACSNETRGIFGGGYITIGGGSYTNTMEYVTIASNAGYATDFGDLTAARSLLAACSSADRGIFGGGGAPNGTNVIDYVTISTTGNATDFGDLTSARSELAACSNGTRGVFGGGATTLNTIEYVTIATPGNATDFGDLSVGRHSLTACSGGA